MPASGRHASLTHCIRTMDRAYIVDPDNGDEAYDLTDDPDELNNLLNPGAKPLGAEFDDLKSRLNGFIGECSDLREKLGVIPGDRGFVEGWE